MKCRRLTEKRLGQIFKDKGLIDQADIERALRLQEENEGRYSFGAALMHLKLVEEEHILEGIVSQYKIPYFPADQYEIDLRAASLVPIEMARAHSFVPVEKYGDVLTVLMANPFKKGLIEEIESLCDAAVHVVLSKPSEIHRALDKVHEDILVRQRAAAQN
ncbi:MAG: hypothetical protein ACM3L6_00960 [Deltaproteobacteria bacterium]